MSRCDNKTIFNKIVNTSSFYLKFAGNNKNSGTIGDHPTSTGILPRFHPEMSKTRDKTYWKQGQNKCFQTHKTCL
jgi:hypothetical protein